MATRAALALLVAAAALAATTTDASACSCAPGDPRQMLVAADAAFVGTLVEEPSGPFSNSGELAPYVFDVEHAVKGQLPKRIEVVSAVSSASCGIGARVGGRIGLFLRRVDGRWHSSLCEQVSPEQLLAAARPLPAPTGTGPVALLAGGSFGEVRTVALDRTGRTLAYGRGRGDAFLLDVCPGGERAVEVARDGQGFWLAVRNLRTMRLVREQPLRLRDHLFPATADCRTAGGDTILLFASREAGPLGVILRLRAGARTQEVHRGQGREAVFGVRHAYLTTGRLATGLVAVDLERGRLRRLRAVPAGTGALALSPDGIRLAGVATSALAANPPPSRVLLVDLRTRTPRLRSALLRSAYVTGRIDWFDNGRLAFMPHGGEDALRVYDTNMRLRVRLDWPARLGVVRHGVAYGITWGDQARVLRATLPGGQPRSDARLPGQTVYALEAVS